MRYIHSDEEIKDAIEKIVRYSDPEPNKETIFIWPEGIFAGVYFEDLKKFSSILSKSFSKKHLLIFGINTESKSSNEFYLIMQAHGNMSFSVYSMSGLLLEIIDVTITHLDCL